MSPVSDLRTTIKDAATRLIGVLNSRNKDIIFRRFGLKTGQKETLESIGQSYGITRERVRQIEEASLKQMRDNLDNSSANIKPFVALAENVLEQAGGVLGENEFYQKFFGADASRNNNNQISNSSLFFVLTVAEKFKKVSEDENVNSLWALSDQHLQSFKDGLGLLIRAFNKKQAPIAENELADFAKQNGILPRWSTQAVLASYLSISKEIGKNIFNQVGLTTWAEVKPRGVRDKSFLVLKREKQPKHFREISQLISQTFKDRRANVQTVHNELIKDSRFVLVGRGLYGLSEWGYKSGTVKDVIVDLLNSAKKPLKREEIVTQVLSHRVVKENTILLNLQDSKIFRKTDEGYTLA